MINREHNTVTLDHALALAQVALAFGLQHRVTRHPSGELETDATHTVMLALIVSELARAAGLDVGLAVQFAVVHDLPETYAEDTDTSRGLTPEQAAAKAEREHLATERLIGELGAKSWAMEMLARYEAQIEPEAQLVRYADKVLPKLTHILNGCRVLRERGMSVDDSRASHERQHAELRERYPELEGVRLLFAAACAGVIETWNSDPRERGGIDIYPRRVMI